MAVEDVLQNQTDITVSTVVQVLVNGTFIGVIQSIEPSMDRTTTPVRGIGTGDRILTRIWQLTDYKLNIQKMALFQKQMINMFGYGDQFRMLAQLRTPIDIQEIISLPDGTNIRETNYRGCYMTSHSAPRSISGEIIVTETAAFDVTSIDDGKFSPFDYDSGLAGVQ